MEDLVARALIKNRIRNCTGCELYKGCMKPVPMQVGDIGGIAVVGEAPGRMEDLTGRPFVGPAGRLLHQTLLRTHLKPATISYVNAVSCFPNRPDPAPKPHEIKACNGNLTDQIRYIKPEYCLVVGRVALSATLDVRASYAEVRGNWFTWDYGGDEVAWCFSTFHPAAVLRGASSAQFTQDLMVFSHLQPTENQWCLNENCDRSATEYLSNLGWCVYHTPLYNRDVEVDQLELF